MKTETSKTAIENYIERIHQIINDGESKIIVGHQLSANPHKYAFYLRKPLLPIGLPFQYKTALIATFRKQGDETIIETSIQTPPFIAISIALTIFAFLFDFLILRTTPSIGGKIFLLGLVASVLVYHSMTRNKIEEAFNYEILALT